MSALPRPAYGRLQVEGVLVQLWKIKLQTSVPHSQCVIIDETQGLVFSQFGKWIPHELSEHH